MLFFHGYALEDLFSWPAIAYVECISRNKCDSQGVISSVWKCPLITKTFFLKKLILGKTFSNDKHRDLHFFNQTRDENALVINVKRGI